MAKETSNSSRQAYEWRSQPLEELAAPRGINEKIEKIQQSTSLADTSLRNIEEQIKGLRTEIHELGITLDKMQKTDEHMFDEILLCISSMRMQIDKRFTAIQEKIQEKKCDYKQEEPVKIPPWIDAMQRLDTVKEIIRLKREYLGDISISLCIQFADGYNIKAPHIILHAARVGMKKAEFARRVGDLLGNHVTVTYDRHVVKPNNDCWIYIELENMPDIIKSLSKIEEEYKAQVLASHIKYI